MVQRQDLAGRDRSQRPLRRVTACKTMCSTNAAMGGKRPAILRTHRRKADVEGSLLGSCHSLTNHFDPKLELLGWERGHLTFEVTPCRQWGARATLTLIAQGAFPAWRAAARPRVDRGTRRRF